MYSNFFALFDHLEDKGQYVGMDYLYNSMKIENITF